jgi:FtsH-binding integral membrane protein
MPRAIPTAGILTLGVFGGLTLSVFVTKKDYSPLRPILCVGSLIALGVIVAGVILGFPLGLFFSFAMVALMSGYILYYTSQVMLCTIAPISTWPPPWLCSPPWRRCFGTFCAS